MRPPLNGPISAERWKTLEPLIDKAVELAPEQRAVFLDSVCNADPLLRAELLALLEAYDRQDSLLDRPAAERFISVFVREPADPPSVLGDRYRVERELGRGGTAIVYLAHDIRHERKVAVKVLHPELAAALGADRFLGEIRTTAQLHHPHILPLHDSGETEGVLFFVMPYVEGASLRRRLERQRQLPIEDAVRIACEVAAALDFAHRHGVIHRDIKPENILLHDGSALVADFGIALAMSGASTPTVSAPGLIVGTPQYMSPEQATGDGAIDARADIYALGTVLYEMIAGQPPFTGATASVMAKRSALPVPALDSLRTGVPAALNAAVTRALEREPVARYGSGSEFAAALEDALRQGALSEVRREHTDVDVQPADSRTPQSATRPTIERRRRRTATVAVLLALVIPLIAATVWLRWPHAATRQRVMVTVFENRTGDTTLDQIGIRVAEYTATALASTKLLDVIASSFDVWRSESARPAHPVSVETLVRQTRATMIVSGSYSRVGDSVVFGIEGLDTRSRKVVFRRNTVSASLFVLGQAEERVRQHVTSAIATRVDPALKPWAGDESAPPVRIDAYREFADGMMSFVKGISSRRGTPTWATHFASAQKHLEDAFRLDSTYYMPAIWWVFSRFNVGDSRGVDSIIRALEPRRDSMVKYEQTLYDYVVANASETPEHRYQLDKTLVVFGPASEYRYCLGRDALEAGRPREALEALKGLDDTFSWVHLMGGMIPSLRIRAFAQLGQFDSALAIATKAKNDLPNDLSPAYPQIDVLAALASFDEIERVVADFSHAPGVSVSDVANLMLYAGLRLQSADREATAHRLFVQALASYTNESPESVAREVIMFGQARSLYYLGRFNDARKLFAELAKRPPGTSRYDKKAVVYLGSLAARRGDTAEVSRLRDRLAKSFPTNGEIQYFDARVAALLDQRDRALELLGTAVALGARTVEVVEEGDATPSMDPDFAKLRDRSKFQRIVALW